MPNPEFTDTAGNREDNSEINHEINPSRNEELGRAATAEIELARARQAEIARKQAELNKRQAELEEKLRALGADPDKIIAEARARELAKKQAQSAESETANESEIAKDLDSNPEAPVLPPTPAEVAEDGKNNFEFKKFITGKVKKVLVGAAIIGVLSTGLVAGFQENLRNTANSKQTTQSGSEVEKTHGIIDGYDQDYMWLAESKETTMDFGDFEKLVEKFDGNVNEAAKRFSENMVESLSDYVSAISDNVQLDQLLPEDSLMRKNKGLDLTETNERIEKKLSVTDYDKLLQEFKDIMDQGVVEEVTVSGPCSNALMAVEDGEGNLLGSKAAVEKGIDVNHENMQLVACTTNEKDAKAYKVSWYTKDGKLLGTILIKKKCGQVIEKGRTKRLVKAKFIEKVPEGEPTPGTKDKDDPEPHKEKHTPKNEEEEKKHAGDGTPLGLDEKTTPKTTLEQDQENFKKIEQQKQEDKQKADEAKRVKEEQAAIEQAAKKEAANREKENATKEQERQAEESKKAAEEQAAIEQAAKAEETKKAADEQAAREKAQEAADEKAAAEGKAAENNGDKTSEERANDFRSGNF